MKNKGKNRENRKNRKNGKSRIIEKFLLASEKALKNVVDLTSALCQFAFSLKSRQPELPRDRRVVSFSKVKIARRKQENSSHVQSGHMTRMGGFSSYFFIFCEIFCCLSLLNCSKGIFIFLNCCICVSRYSQFVFSINSY